MNLKAIVLLALALPTLSAFAARSEMIEELDPFADNIEEQLIENDILYKVQEVANSAEEKNFTSVNDCYQRSCKVFLDIDKSRQRAQLFIDGAAVDEEWKVTTGSPGHDTPNFNRHPEQPLRVYNKYSSSKFPGGDWNGLGNMPYVVFIKGGFGVHGTPSIKHLGTTPKSHGCIRVHPLKGKIFNGHVRAVGAKQTWITVRN